MSSRSERLVPGGVPRWIRCYDNGGETIDRYTVVYTHLGHLAEYGRLAGWRGYSCHISMSHNPTWPTGVGMHGESEYPIDRPTYGHLGRKIKFEDLPDDCRKVVLSDYKALWKLEEADANPERTV